MAFSLFKKEASVNESKEFMKLTLERDIRVHLPRLSNAVQANFKSSKEWKTSEASKIMFREMYREDIKNETRPLTLFKEMRSDPAFKEFSDHVLPVHIFFDVGKYGQKEAETIHTVIIPGYTDAKSAYKVYGFVERNDELHSCSRIFNSLGEAEFAKEFSNFVQQVQWRREFPGTKEIIPKVEDQKIRNTPRLR
jgi:hypothetical protein